VDPRGGGSTQEPQAAPSVTANTHSSTTRRGLLLYIAATPHVVSTTNLVERPDEGHSYGVQRPVYFISEVLSESKARYPSIQKILYGILITSRKLRDEYKISVVTDFPLANILHNQNATRRISKWVVELGALKIKFKLRTAIKSHALVDCLAEWRENQVPAPPNILKHWVMYFDHSLKLEGGGARVLFISPRENSSNMHSISYLKSLTTKQNTRYSCMDFAWQFPSVSSDYLCSATLYSSSSK
jgi:hypothetical protein